MTAFTPVTNGNAPAIIDEFFNLPAFLQPGVQSVWDWYPQPGYLHKRRSHTVGSGINTMHAAGKPKRYQNLLNKNTFY
jgi:hypothetical protein